MSVPFNIACGTCRNCNSGWTSFCLRTNPTEGIDGAAYGYANMAPIRVVKPTISGFRTRTSTCSNSHPEPSGRTTSPCCRTFSRPVITAPNSPKVAPGYSVAVFGAGPVGLLAAHSAFLRGASQVFVADKEPDRLQLAKQIDAIPIDISPGVIRSNRSWMQPTDEASTGASRRSATRRTIPRGKNTRSWCSTTSSRSSAPREASASWASTCPRSGAATEAAKVGRIGWDYGTFFTKGQRMGTGQAPVKRYNRQLRDLIINGRARPRGIAPTQLALVDAPTAYENFDRRVDGWTKVLLHPSHNAKPVAGVNRSCDSLGRGLGGTTSKRVRSENPSHTEMADTAVAPDPSGSRMCRGPDPRGWSM